LLNRNYLGNANKGLIFKKTYAKTKLSEFTYVNTYASC